MKDKTGSVDPTPEINDLPDGINQSGVRNHNERLVLSMIQRHGAMASAEVARNTNLSAQTASVITRKLEERELLKRGDPVRGKVGKPLIPMQLDPDGVLSMGLRIGRRSADLVLMDFTGSLRAHKTCTYPYPTPSGIVSFVESRLHEVLGGLSAKARAKVAGLGIARPFQLWNWLDDLGAPKHEMIGWQAFRFDEAFERLGPGNVIEGNDVTLSCAAEHMFGAGKAMADFAYFFVGSFIGGGVVLNNSVLSGRTGNAAAFGTIPVRDTSRPGHQLIQNASMYLLERRLQENGISTELLFDQDADWTGIEDYVRPWIDDSARHIATAAVAACAVLDVEAVVIDGGFPAPIRDRMVEAVERHVETVDTQGIQRPRILAGSLGRMSGALGAAYQPIIAKYLLGPTPTSRHQSGY